MPTRQTVDDKLCLDITELASSPQNELIKHKRKGWNWINALLLSLTVLDASVCVCVSVRSEQTVGQHWSCLPRDCQQLPEQLSDRPLQSWSWSLSWSPELELDLDLDSELEAGGCPIPYYCFCTPGTPENIPFKLGGDREREMCAQ